MWLPWDHISGKQQNQDLTKSLLSLPLHAQYLGRSWRWSADSQYIGLWNNSYLKNLASLTWTDWPPNNEVESEHGCLRDPWSLRNLPFPSAQLHILLGLHSMGTASSLPRCAGQSCGRGRMSEHRAARLLMYPYHSSLLCSITNRAMLVQPLDLLMADACHILRQHDPLPCVVYLEIDGPNDKDACWDLHNDVQPSKESDNSNIIAMCPDCIYLDKGAFFVQKHLCFLVQASVKLSGFGRKGEEEIQLFPIYRRNAG